MASLDQGTIIKIGGVKHPVLVVSKDYYNSIGQIIGCPIIQSTISTAIYKEIIAGDIHGTVLCDQLKNFDLNARGYTPCGKISLDDRLEISDIIQGLFDYI